MIRVSFGTALIASIVIVYTAIITLVTSSRRYVIIEISQISQFIPILFLFFFFVNALIIFINYSEDDNRGRRGGRSYDSGFNFYFNPVDLFWWGGYLSLNVTLFKYSFNL